MFNRLLRNEGKVVNRKRTWRLYREARLPAAERVCEETRMMDSLKGWYSFEGKVT